MERPLQLLIIPISIDFVLDNAVNYLADLPAVRPNPAEKNTTKQRTASQPNPNTLRVKHVMLSTHLPLTYCCMAGHAEHSSHYGDARYSWPQGVAPYLSHSLLSQTIIVCPSLNYHHCMIASTSSLAHFPCASLLDPKAKGRLSAGVQIESLAYLIWSTGIASQLKTK
jgi:hypothetical protein